LHGSSTPGRAQLALQWRWTIPTSTNVIGGGYDLGDV
jgi:hypothetical protein